MELSKTAELEALESYFKITQGIVRGSSDFLLAPLNHSLNITVLLTPD